MLKLDLAKFPELETERLILRQLTMDDAENMHMLRSDEDIMQYIGRPRSGQVEDCVALIKKIDEEQANHQAISWGISIKPSTKLIGTIGLYRLKLEHYRGEVGYLLDKKLWGQGLMSEALKAVLRYSFQTAGFNSIEADVSSDNANSAKILERNGFKLEGQFREYFHFDGKFYDTHVYSILASEFGQLS